MSENLKRHDNADSNTGLAQSYNQVQEAKMRLYTVAVKKANASQRKVVRDSNLNTCLV